ncbi:hypothetical protein ACPCAB_29810 [Streptomyces koyangensis]|uniref:hypothetical protein n=1 Tax=Streptomyces TaxID=1883 RepID=UPI001F5DC19A|nr:hypothetical protein [Streptomyces sp. SCA2-2]
MIEDDTTTWHALQRALTGMHWIFGGRVIGQADRRRLVPGDEVDIPLIRGDGSFQVVELKRAAGVKLVKNTGASGFLGERYTTRSARRSITWWARTRTGNASSKSSESTPVERAPSSSLGIRPVSRK